MEQDEDKEQKSAPDRDEPVSIPLDPEEALRGLLTTQPEEDKQPLSPPPKPRGEDQ